jgi:hypothetical protein
LCRLGSIPWANNLGQKAQPLVKDGIIYITDHEKTVALDFARSQPGSGSGPNFDATVHAP